METAGTLAAYHGERTVESNLAVSSYRTQVETGDDEQSDLSCVYARKLRVSRTDVDALTLRRVSHEELTELRRASKWL